MAHLPAREAALPTEHVTRFGTGPVPQGARLRSSEVGDWLRLSRDADPALRRRAVQALCPCHVHGDAEGMWERIIELTADPDVGVRRLAFHALTDGSPRSREADVVSAIEGMRSDPEPKLRRNVRKFLAQYRRSGRVNVN